MEKVRELIKAQMQIAQAEKDAAYFLDLDAVLEIIDSIIEYKESIQPILFVEAKTNIINNDIPF